MREPAKHFGQSSWLSASLLLGSLVLVVAVLYLAREVFIPVALATLITFILAPAVTLLRRHGLGRMLAVTITVVLTMAVVGGIGTMIVVQLKSLANDLPSYRHNILKKIGDLRVLSRSGSLEKVQKTIREVTEELKKDDPADVKAAPSVPVTVTNEKDRGGGGMSLVGPLLNPLASAGLVVVLVIFMLLRREDLRDRLLGLAGYGGLAATTKAVDDAGTRVSRYLLYQLILNTGFGVAIGLGLFFIGLPYPMLWGVLAGVARFIPYLGPLLGAIAPILVSLAVFDAWTTPLIVFALVIGLELFNNMVMEPLLYGQSIGVSEVALIVMMAFWTWLWGPIGLILAAPLTVCLMVFSKGVPDLDFIGVLLSSDPALAPHHVLYQRLVAKDQDEAQEVVDEFLKEHTREEMFEQLLIPTLVTSRHDFSRSRLQDEDLRFAFQSIRELIYDSDSTLDAEPDSPHTLAKKEPGTETSNPTIIGYPANDEADELALLMLAEILQAKGHSMNVLSHDVLCNEALGKIAEIQPAVVCVGMLPDRPVFPIRQFCKRLRPRIPNLPIILGRWGGHDREKIKSRFSDLVADMGWTLSESANQAIQFSQISPAAAEPAPTEAVQKGSELTVAK